MAGLSPVDLLLATSTVGVALRLVPTARPSQLQIGLELHVHENPV